MTNIVLEVENLTKRFGNNTAIRDVSFKIKTGEVVGFVGLNGAGKSTTINAILGFIRPTDGKIEIFDQPVTPENAFRGHQSIGFASGDMALFESLTGEQYLQFALHQYKVRDRSRLNELIEIFKPDLAKKIGELSRGNRQKVALIAAFMASPKLVVLDEPSSGLDPLMQQRFLELIRAEQERGTTIFMSSHYLNEVVDVCTRIVLIRSGQIVRDFPAKELSINGGKAVKVVSRHKLPGLKGAEDVKLEKTANGTEVSFIYKGTPTALQAWLGSLPHLVDFSVNDNTVEMALEDLYEKESPDA